MRVLCVAHAWPEGESVAGIFVKRQVDSLRRLGCEMDVSVVGPASGKRWSDNVRALRRQVARLGYDVIHAQYGGRTALAAAVSAAQTPLVISFCGSDLNGLTVGSRWERTYAAAGVLCSQLAARVAGELILKSERLRGKLWLARDRRRVHIVPNGVDLDLFRPFDRYAAREELGWPRERPMVLASGQSDSQVKRLDLAEAAVKSAQRLIPELALQILRGVHPDRVPVYLNAADVVLLTSQHEGSPNIVKEALACGVSVVAVDVGDVRQWLDATPGCWLAERHPAALADSIIRAVRGGGRSDGRNRVASISLEAVARKILAVYQKAKGGGQ